VNTCTDHKREAVVSLFNKAINSTLSRTLNTGVCTLLVLIIIFFFGGVSIKASCSACSWVSWWVPTPPSSWLPLRRSGPALAQGKADVAVKAWSPDPLQFKEVPPHRRDFLLLDRPWAFPLLFDISGGEFIVILLFALLFFGSKGIPDLARTLGRTMRQVRDASNEVQREIQRGCQ
jgi:TatA/E family protein of Tat protein translocase